MQTYTLDTFFNELESSVNTNQSPRSFCELLSLNFIKYDATRIAALQNSLQQFDSKSLTSIIDNNKFTKKISWPAFESFLFKYLICIRDFDPWSIINSIDLFIGVFETESLLFNPKTSNHEKITNLLIPLFNETMILTISLCELIDTESMKIQNRVSNYPRLTHISAILLKSINNIRSTPDLNSELNLDKIELLFKISNTLCNVYYKIGSPILCSNVFSNINILNLNKKFIKKSLIIKFRFIMGKYYAHQSNFLNSYNHLNESFKLLDLNTCPTSNVVLLLKYLIPIGLIVGKIANVDEIRRKFNNPSINKLLDLYEPLIKNFKSGNMFSVYQYISLNEEYFKKLGIWISMLQRLRILIFRNLVYKLWKLNNGILSLRTVKIGVYLSINGLNTLKPIYQIANSYDNEVNDQFVVNILTSLNFNGFLKIKMTGPTSFVLGKNDTFPNVYNVSTGRYPKNPREAWLDK